MPVTIHESLQDCAIFLYDLLVELPNACDFSQANRTECLEYFLADFSVDMIQCACNIYNDSAEGHADPRDCGAIENVHLIEVLEARVLEQLWLA